MKTNDCKINIGRYRGMKGRRKEYKGDKEKNGGNLWNTERRMRETRP